MKAIIVDAPGDEDVLQLREVDAPRLSDDSVRIAIAATAVNRADLLQRRGMYPPPPGASEIIGLECAGTISEVGAGVARWHVGDRVMALLPGGGYAEEAIAHEGSVMPVPESLSDEEAAAFPEAFLTAYLNIFQLGHARRGESVLIHGGGSGVGTAGIALCRLREMKIFATVGSQEKAARLRELGVAHTINYKTSDFADEIARLTAQRGVDVILDHIGGAYFARNLASLARDGRLVIIGSMGGVRGSEIDVSSVLERRLSIIGSTLRSRSNEFKKELVAAFLEQFGEELRAGLLRPIIDRVFPLASAAEAHRLMKSSEHFGKIVLRVR